MKSKNPKIQIFRKGMAILLATMFMLSPIAYATTSLDDSYLEGSFFDKLLYGKIGSTAKEIEEYLQRRETLYIVNETQLRALAEYVNNGNSCEGKEIILLNDIEVDSTEEWVPIGTKEAPFKGAFDGAGHTISGIRFNKINKTYEEMTNVGLFGYVEKASTTEIKNIVLANSVFDIQYEDTDITTYASDNTFRYKNLGGIVGYNKQATIENCKILSDVDIKGNKNVGGIVGYNYQGKIKGCSNKGTIIGIKDIGGISGIIEGDSTARDNYSTLNFSGNTVAKIINCANEGDVYAYISEVGGISGSQKNSSIIQKCVNKGNVRIVATEKIGNVYIQNAGGIVGWISGCASEDLSEKYYSAIDGCINFGSVKGLGDIGGIAGQLGGQPGGFGNMDGGYAILSNCINYSTNIKATITDSTYGEAGYLAGEVGVGKTSIGIMYNNLYVLNTTEDKDTIREYDEKGNESTTTLVLAYGNLAKDSEEKYYYDKFNGEENSNSTNIVIVKNNKYSIFGPKAVDNNEYTTKEMSQNYNLSKANIENYTGNDVIDDQPVMFMYYPVATEVSTTDSIKIKNKNVCVDKSSVLYEYDKDLGLFDLVGRDNETNIIGGENTTDIIDKTTNTTVEYTIKKNDESASIKGNAYFKAGDKIKVTAKFNKYLAETYGPLTKITTAPTLKLNNSIEMDAGNINTSGYTTTITYEYTVKPGDNIDIKSLNLSTSGYIYAISGDDYLTNHPSIRINKANNISNIQIDTIAPLVTTKAYVENALENGRYTAGKEILINVTTSERIQGDYEDLGIQVTFSESGVGKYNYTKEPETVGYAKCKDAKINIDGTTTWIYSYQIQEGDEGYLSLAYKSGKITDLAGNETILTKFSQTTPGEGSNEVNLSENLTGKNVATGASETKEVTYKIYKGTGNSKTEIVAGTNIKNEDSITVTASIPGFIYSEYANGTIGNRATLLLKETAPKLIINDKEVNAANVSHNKTIPSGTNQKNYDDAVTTLTYEIKGEYFTYTDRTQLKTIKLEFENKIYISNRYVRVFAENDAGTEELYDVGQFNKVVTLIQAGAKSGKDISGLRIYIDPIGIEDTFDTKDIYADTTRPTVEIRNVNTIGTTDYDFDENGYTDGNDVYSLLKYATGITLPSNVANNVKSRGDLNSDGKINAVDARKLLQYLEEATSIINNDITNADIITYQIVFSEEVTGFTEEDITVLNGTIEENSFIEVDGVYTVRVKPSVTVGNQGTLKVIIEDGVCQDLAALYNIRQEKDITIDKIKPEITDAKVTKEDNKLKVEATYSEALSDASKSELDITIGGKEARGSLDKAVISSEEPNKVTYIYNIDGSDGGKVEITISGKVKDIAGNDSEELSKSIQNEITLEQEVIKDENGKVTYSFKKGNNGISFTEPTYFQINDEITVTKDEIIEVDGVETEKVTNYTHTITEELDLTHMKYMNLVEPAEGETAGTVTFSENKATGSVDITEANIYFDTIAPKVMTEITAKNPKDGLYTTGEEFIITATSSEKLSEKIAPETPEISVKFGETAGKFNNGKVQYVETKENENGTTTWTYRYVVSQGDEGKVSLEYVAGKVVDLAENTTTLIKLNQEEDIFKLNNITVDATAPTVEMSVKKAEGTTKTNVKNNVTNASKLEYTFTWSEEVTGFTAEDVTVNNGNKVTFAQSTTDQKVYTMTVDTNVEAGNVGDIQVIIEQNACQDIVGHANVRTESVIRVDKQAPILVSLEAHASSDIKLDNKVDTVKEYYKVGDTVTVIATFSENIENTTTVPTLALQFSESGNAKGTVSEGEKSGNKITYIYKITDKDIGTLSVKGFSGKVIDTAGNETTVTKRTLGGDTIISDTKAPTLVGLTAIAPNFKYEELLENPGDTKRYGIGNTITIIAEYSENVYSLSSNTIKEITDTTDPVLELKFGTRTAKYYKTEGSKIYYTYNIISGDNGNLAITSLNGTVSDIAGNICTTNTTLPTLIKYEDNVSEENKVDNITADTTKSTLEVTKVSGVSKDDTGNILDFSTKGYYRKGSIITIVVTSDEYIYKNSNKNLERFTTNTAPQLNINFDINGTAKGKCTEVKYENNRTIFTYTYTIANGDNGILSIDIAESQGYDIALNGNNAKTQSLSGISGVTADTVNPVTNWQSWVESEQYGIIDNENGTWKVTFNEQLYEYNPTTHYVGRILQNDSQKQYIPILLVSKDNQTALETTVSNISTNESGKTVITYSYSPYTRNIGAYGMKFANTTDIAGNLFNYKDQVAPTLSNIKVTSPITGTYKAGTEVTIVATFSEKITGTAPILTLNVGEESAKGTVSGGTIDGNTITYTYTIADGDNGVISINTYTGTGLKDLSDNPWVAPENVTLIGNKITADTIAPKVTITSDVEKTNKEKVVYTFTWDEQVLGFDKEDIEVTNGSKGEFKAVGTDGKVYTLEVDTNQEGRQIIRLNSGICTDIAGNENTERASYNKVLIDFTKPIIRAKVNGGNYVIDKDKQKSTLKESIVVNEELSEFKYIWSTSTTIPEEGWISGNVDKIDINSDINLSAEVVKEGTVYLYVKVIDVAGNEAVGKTNAFVIGNSEITLKPNITTITNQDVTVNVTYGTGLTENLKAGVQGKTVSADPKVVIIEENGIVYAEATDKAGNKIYNSIEITNIDKIAPEAQIAYETNEDKSVTATITFNEETIITNNEGNNKYTFNENGEFIFEFRDIAGNKGVATAVVTSIDKTPPQATINYTTNDDGSVTATISFNEETIITNNDGKNEYVFTENGEFIFEFKDLAGNTGTAKAIVVSIKDNTEPENPPVEEDKTAPEITFNYTTTTATVGTTIGATITTNEDAIISYSWDNQDWTASKEYVRNQKAVRTPTKDGTYTLYAKAIDKASNTSSVSTLEFTVVKSQEDIVKPEIIFEDLVTIQKNEIKYVKLPTTYTKEQITEKMNKDALVGKTPTYNNLTKDNEFKTGSEIKIDGETKYIIIVNGDVNCDGKVDFLGDIVKINNYRIGIGELSDIQILAGDINNSGTIEFIPDIVAMNNYRLGRIKVL